MGKPQRRRRTGVKNKKLRRMMKMRNGSLFDDQRFSNLKPENLKKIKEKDADISLPGLGQFYCVCCDKHFVNLKAFMAHLKTKGHKRKMKMMKEKPFDHKEAALLNR